MSDRTRITKRGRVTVRRSKVVRTGLFWRQQLAITAKTNFEMLPVADQRKVLKRWSAGLLTAEEEENLFAIDDLDRVFEHTMTTTKWLNRYEERATEALQEHGHSLPLELAGLLKLERGGGLPGVAAAILTDVRVARRHLEQENAEGLGQVCFRLAWNGMHLAFDPIEPVVLDARKRRSKLRKHNESRGVSKEDRRELRRQARCLWGRKSYQSTRAVAKQLAIKVPWSEVTVRRIIQDLKPPRQLAKE